MKVAIIPARGGSKRIPRKNIKNFSGRPMIAYSISAAQDCGLFDRIIVSTDDEEIADIAEGYGAEVPFIRPKELSDDFTGTIPVIKHALEWLEQKGERISVACCIYATAPFILPEDLIRGYNLLNDKDCHYAFSVTSYAFPIQRALKITNDNQIVMFDPTMFTTRSQDLEEAWHDAGQFYWGKRDAWLEEKMIFSKSSRPVVLPRDQVQDIDTPEDWTVAEWIYKAKKLRDENSIPR